MEAAQTIRESALGEAFLFEPPRLADVPRLLPLTKNLRLDEPAWRSVMAARNGICAKTANGEIAGACIANHYSLIYRGDEFRQLRGGLSVLCNRFKLADTDIAFGTVTAVTQGHESGELRILLLRALLREVGFRYHHLFRFCLKDDPLELHALETEGWRCFQEEDDKCYFTLDVARALRGLASRLAFSHMHLRPHRSERELPLH